MRRVLEDVECEMLRQRELWGEQHHVDGTGRSDRDRLDLAAARDACGWNSSAGMQTWLSILREEFLEAATEQEEHRLRSELVQVAAVAASWIEAIDRRSSCTS